MIQMPFKALQNDQPFYSENLTEENRRDGYVCPLCPLKLIPVIPKTDRAVFHFLVDDEDQKKYLEVLKETLDPAGVVVVATFALDGPSKCSGLDVVRYGKDSICRTFGSDFQLIGQYNESHFTPSEKEQSFSYFMFRRVN